MGLWDPVVRPLVSFAFTSQVTAFESSVNAYERGPLWFRYSDHLNPLVVLEEVQEGLFVITGHATVQVRTTAPLFLYGVIVTLLFATVPVYLGYRRFSRSTLS